MHKTNTILKLKKGLSKLGLVILVLLLITLVGFPLLWMALSSLKPVTELFKIPPSILPKSPSLDWYRSAFSDSTVLHYFWNSLRIAAATMLIDMVIGTMAAYSLSRFQYKGRKLLTAGVLSAYCIPPIMLMIPLYRIIAADLGARGGGGPAGRRCHGRTWPVEAGARAIPRDAGADRDRRGSLGGWRKRGENLFEDRFTAVLTRPTKHWDHGFHSFME